ncbi:MAG: zinc ribbon domain-containing protein [Methylotetracoccus sp.]|jgi:putative FmdB family regulatory protein|nr:zinc ribbon domain-containing protein [Methylotetracoccus sp.]
MPIYEFYCQDCHTVFNFFSRRVDTEKRPACPKCQRPEIDRRVSLVTVLKGGGQGGGDEKGELPDFDEAKMERALQAMAGEFEQAGEDDPRAMGRLMRKFIDSAGMKLGSGMEEALRRLESGEDPDRIESEMGDVLEAENPFQEGSRAALTDWRHRVLPPKVDETLYEL